MGSRLVRTWVAVAAATLVVVVVSIVVLRAGLRRAEVDCRGRFHLEPPPASLPRTAVFADDMQFERGRLVWGSPEPLPACGAPPSLVTEKHAVHNVYRDSTTSRWLVVRGSSSSAREVVAAVRRDDVRGRVLARGKLLDAAQIPSLVSVVALAALLVAGICARRATAYATKMHAWKEATARQDGLLESETGATLGKVDPGARVRPGAVLVDPESLGARGVYRELPIVVRGHIVRGSHTRWRDGTARRMRDARVLSAVSATAAGVSLLAHVVAG